MKRRDDLQADEREQPQATPTTPEKKVLDLQAKAGNRAVARLLSSGGSPVLARAPQPKGAKAVKKAPPKPDLQKLAEQDRRFFIDRTIPALAYVVEQYAALQAKAERLAAAYERAWEAHTKALDAAKASERLLGDLMVDAMLAFVPGGIGGVTGEFFKNAKASPFVVDGMKDLVKITIRRQVSRQLTESEGWQPEPGTAGPAFRALGDNPFQWRAEIVARLKDEESFVAATVRSWSQHATADFLSKGTYNFDPLGEISRLFTIGNSPAKDLADPDEKTQYLFEKGLWQAWIKHHRYYLKAFQSVGVSYSGTNYQVGDRSPGYVPAGGLSDYLAGQHIRNRLRVVAEKLGEKPEAADRWLDEWAAESLKAVEAARDKKMEGTLPYTIKKGVEKVFSIFE